MCTTTVARTETGKSGDRQVHLRFTKYRTGRLRHVYNYRRKDRTDKYPNNVCTTTVDLEDPVDVKFLEIGRAHV